MTEEEKKMDTSMRLECIRLINGVGYSMSRAQEYYDFIKGKRFKKPRNAKKPLLTEDGREVQVFGTDAVN